MIETPSTLLVVIALAWLAIGLALSLLMGRRGHDSFSWLIVGTVMGPMAAVMALDSWRHGEALRREILSEPGAPAGGVDVVVGFDGSDESRSALNAVVGLLEPSLGRITLATVIPFDSGWEVEREAVAALEQQAARVEKGRSVGLEVVRGHPSKALTQLALEGGYHLLAIGTRGAGASKALMGSTASELTRRSRIPVLLVSAFAQDHPMPEAPTVTIPLTADGERKEPGRPDGWISPVAGR